MFRILLQHMRTISYIFPIFATHANITTSATRWLCHVIPQFVHIRGKGANLGYTFRPVP